MKFAAQSVRKVFYQLLIVFVWVIPIQGQEVDISGTVSSVEGPVIENAKVTLVKLNLSSTTDAQGKYSIKQGISSTRYFKEYLSLKFNRGQLHFRTTSPEHVSIALYKTTGKKVHSIVNQVLPAGDHQFMSGGIDTKYGIHLLRFSVGSRLHIFKLSGNNLGIHSSQSLALAKTTAPAEDNIRAEAAGFVTRTVPVSDYIGTLNIELSPNCMDSSLNINDRLVNGEYICSENGEYKFGLTDDGNLALWSASETKWSADISGTSIELVLQSDGNMVAYNGTESLWSSKTSNNPGAALKLQNDGSLIMTLDDKVIWNIGADLCPDDPNKTAPGVCGCGKPEGTCGTSNPLSNLHVKLDGIWKGVCCNKGDLVLSEAKCTWTEGGRYMRTKDVSTGNATELDCPENGQRPTDCWCDGNGERMHGIEDGNVAVSNSLRLPNGGPIYPNSGHQVCIDLVNGAIEGRYSTNTCPNWRMVNFY